jgi:hypothetical protein
MNVWIIPPSLRTRHRTSGQMTLGPERGDEGANDMSTSVASQEFREGDEVVLAEGTYQGTLGIFVRLRKDVNWADITERNGSVRSHPVAWLHHSTGAIHGSVN